MPTKGNRLIYLGKAVQDLNDIIRLKTDRDHRIERVWGELVLVNEFRPISSKQMRTKRQPFIGHLLARRGILHAILYNLLG
jgi:hypothetical protein